MCCPRKGRVEWALKERDGFNGFSKKGTSSIGSQRKGPVEWILKERDELNWLGANIETAS